MVGGGVGALLEFMFYLSPYVLSWDSSRGFAGVDDTLLSHPFHILLEYTAHPRSSPARPYCSPSWPSSPASTSPLRRC
jgi:hypothetical protein